MTDKIMTQGKKYATLPLFSLRISTCIARHHAQTDLYNGMPLIIHS